MSTRSGRPPWPIDRVTLISERGMLGIILVEQLVIILLLLVVIYALLGLAA